ncbi:Haloacid dehalogenase-like hydrolase [uncultured archaeon]|nr:Haloacid dehalogenase-like hydrolase [uncultured archaeon]
MIKCILFDMGGVILTAKIEQVLERVAAAFNVPLEELMQIRKDHKTELWDGKMKVKDIVKRLKKKYSIKKSVPKLMAIWEKTYLESTYKNEAVCLIAKKLMKNYEVGLISNLWDFHAELNKKRKVFDGFNPCILSTAVGMHKPQKEIFELAIKQAKVNGEECVFIDDRNEYFFIAQSLGMKTIEFGGAEQLLKDLKKMGVEVE